MATEQYSAKEIKAYEPKDIDDAQRKLNQDVYTPINGSELDAEEILDLGHDLAQVVQSALTPLYRLYGRFQNFNSNFPGRVRGVKDSLN